MSSLEASLSVIVLAGGYSRRMGVDKALLTYQGQSLIGRTIHVAQQLSTDVIVITPWPERYQPSLPDAVRYVMDRYVTESTQQPAAGPLNGFAQGLRQTHSDWCLLLACDLPYLEINVLQQWWQWILSCASAQWPHLPTKPMASLVTTQGSERAKISSTTSKLWQPLCGYYHRSCLASLNQQLATPQRSFQTWLATLPIARYDAVPPTMLFNCNTPTDWTQVVTSHSLDAKLL